MSYPPPPGPDNPYGQQPEGQQPQGQPYGQPQGQPYGGYPPPGQPMYTPPQAQPTAGSATTSLILGILSCVLCGFFTGIPAIILGVKARREVRNSNGRVGGDGLALGGIITGVLGTLLGLALLAFVIFVVWLGADAVDEIDRIYDEQCEKYANDADPSNDCP